MNKISDLFLCLGIIFFWSVTSSEDLSTKTCAELQVVDGESTVKAIKIKEGSYVNITFELRTHKCQYTPDWFRVRVATSQKGLRLPICTIVFHGYTCNVTESSSSCQCLGKGQMYSSMYKRVSQSETAFILEWTDATTLPKQQEKTIWLDFTEKEEGGLRTSVILGVCFAVLLALVAIASIITFLRKCKDLQHQSQCEHSSHTYINTHETPQTRRFARSEAAASNRTSLQTRMPQNTRTTSSSQVPADNQVTLFTRFIPNSQVREESQEISHSEINVNNPVVVYRYDHIFL